MGTRLAGNVTAGRDSQLVVLGDPAAGAAVAVGPSSVDPSTAVAALQELVRAGGVVAAGGNVDLGGGFHSARLAGGTGDRRDGIVAALRVVSPERLGDRFGVLVALFGPAATKPVGAAAMKAIDERRFAALTLAAGASDVLGPEQLVRILALDGDPVGDPVGDAAPSVIAAHLATLFPRVLPKRRLDLLVSLWHRVGAQLEAQRRVDLRLAGQTRTRIEELRAAHRAREDELVVQRVQAAFGGTPTLADAARWVPDVDWVRGEMHALLVDAFAATALLRAAIAVAEYGVQTGIQLALPQLKAAGVDDICRYVRPGRILSVEDSELVVERLSHAYDAGVVVLDAATEWLDFASGLPWDPAQYWDVRGLAEWRKVAGYSALRPPETWIERPALSPLGTPALADREPRVEQVADLLWLAEVADEVARFHGHERAVVDGAFPTFNVDPTLDVEPAGPNLRDDSVPAALAGAAQLVAFGATPPRTSDWSRFADGLAADALVAEAFTNVFTIPPVLAERDGSAIPGTPLRLEVARNPRQLAGWAQEMGNCIAGPGYVHYAQTGRSVLAALRAPDGRLLANVEIMPRGKARGWRVEEMKARFNADPSPELVSRFTEWLGSLPRPAPVFVERGFVEPSVGRAFVERVFVESSVGRAFVERVFVESSVGRVDRPRRRPARRPSIGGPLSEAAASALAAVEPSLAVLAPLVDAAAVRRWLADGGSLAALWAAAGVRPLSVAIEALDPALRSAWHHLDLLTVAEPLSGSLLSLARRPPIAEARSAELLASHVRWSICHLAQADDPVLALSVRRTADQDVLRALLMTLNTAGLATQTIEVPRPEADTDGLPSCVRVPRSWLGRGGWRALWHESAKRVR